MNHARLIGRIAGRIAPLALALLVLLFALGTAQHAAAAEAPSITVSFDHLPTGFELDGVHRDLPCESCHLNAVFKGTPRDCGTCHIKGSPFNATPKTANHIPTTNYCAACHNTISFRPDVHFDHAQVMGSCVSCHNGTIAQGEGPTHPATSQDCDACHTVMSWNPPKAVDHSQIPLAVAGYCIICHNGVQASGKSAGHIATNLECGDCHLTTTWLGASFDHTGITSGCVSCHNGTKAVGKQGNHMPTTNLCENCHTTGIGTKTPSWAPSKFDHTQMTVTTCQTCHSGTVKITTGFVSGQPTNHVPPIPSAIDCGVCHGNNPAAETWTVLAASIATLHTGLPVEQLSAVPCRGDVRRRPRALHSHVDFRRVADQDDAARAAAHSHPRRHRLQRLPRCRLSGRRLRSGDGDERGEARVRVHDLRYLPRHRQELLCRQRYAAAAAAGGSREQQRRAHGDQRLFGVPRDQGLGQHRDADRPHAESEQLDVRTVPYLRAERLHAGHARGERRAAHRDHRKLRAVPREHDDGAHVVQQLHAQGCDAHAVAYSLPVGHRLQ